MPDFLLFSLDVPCKHRMHGVAWFEKFFREIRRMLEEHEVLS